MTQPRLAAAHSLLDQGDLTGATAAFEAAAQEPALRCQALTGLGMVALAQKRPDQAIANCKAAVATDPNNVEALTALGAAFIQAGQAAKATTVLAETVKRHPTTLNARIHLVRAFLDAGRPDDAMFVARETTAAFSDSAEAWRIKGRAERVAGELKDAKDSLDRALAITPGHSATLNDLGVVCRALKNYPAAVAHYRAAIEANPELAIAHANLGNALELMNQPADAEASLRRAYDLDPSASDTAYNLGCLLTKLEQPEEGATLLETVVRSVPERWDAWTNLGVARLDCGDTEGAEAALRQALTLRPGNPEARYNLAWLLLLTGRYEEGWAEFESRWDLPEFSSERSQCTAPIWMGGSLEGKTLLVQAEQGFGDAIQFVRFVADITKGSGKLVFECGKPLTGLLSQLSCIDEVRAPGASSHDIDFQVPLLSLPHRLGHDGSRRPDAAGYLTAPQAADHLRLPNIDRRRIGIVWAGSPDNKIDRRRRMAAADFMPLFDATDADFVSLQVGPAASGVQEFPGDRVVFAAEGRVTNFAETAAMISQLDLVIGVDTAVMHLAGAMAKPAWIILPVMPDYRWGLGSDSTPWYDSVCLFRQKDRGSWSGVIAEICTALSSW